MNDKSLLNELELLQDLSEEEAEAISGGNLALTQDLSLKRVPIITKLPPLGGCPACFSGIPIIKEPYLEITRPS